MLVFDSNTECLTAMPIPKNANILNYMSAVTYNNNVIYLSGGRNYKLNYISN